jgi:hypothetical protein
MLMPVQAATARAQTPVPTDIDLTALDLHVRCLLPFFEASQTWGMTSTPWLASSVPACR